MKRNSKIITPITILLHKDTEFLWTAECEIAFNSLKNALSSAPILAYPDMTTDFDLTTDASNQSIGYVLSQRGPDGKDHQIAYGVRSLSKAGWNWYTTDKECLTVIAGVKQYISYLLYSKCTIYTDHKAIMWLHERNTHPVD